MLQIFGGYEMQWPDITCSSVLLLQGTIELCVIHVTDTTGMCPLATAAENADTVPSWIYKSQQTYRLSV